MNIKHHIYFMFRYVKKIPFTKPISEEEINIKKQFQETDKLNLGTQKKEYLKSHKVLNIINWILIIFLLLLPCPIFSFIDIHIKSIFYMFILIYGIIIAAYYFRNIYNK